MTGRIPKRAARLAAAVLAAAGVLAMTAGAASASEVIYNNIPSPLPGNVPSQAFLATQTSEFGGQVEVEGSLLANPNVSVTMSSWECGNLKSGAECATAAGQHFEWPITLNVYAVGAGNEPGAKIATITQTFKIPYRPSAKLSCGANSEGVYGWGASCSHGKAHVITFKTLKGVTLPSKVIISVAYSTAGTDIGQDGLNVGLTGTPTVGHDPLPADAYINSNWSGAYCSGSTGTFRLDSGCWTGYQPEIKVTGTATPTTYMAIGDSLGFGYKEETFLKNYPAEPTSAFEGGYVGVFATKLAAAETKEGNGLQTVNLSCPGETTGGMIGNGPLGTALEGAYGGTLAVASPCKYHKAGFPLKTEQGGASELEAALGVLAAGPSKVKAVTLNMGSNDELETLTKCGEPAYDKAHSFVSFFACVQHEAGEEGYEYYGGLFKHIITNIAITIGVLRAHGYTGPVILQGFYNPKAIVVQGSDTLQKELNSTFEFENLPKSLEYAPGKFGPEAFGPGVKYANPFPTFNPQTSKEQEKLELYTEMYNAFDIAHTGEGDIHPTKLGYEKLGTLMWMNK